MLIPENSSQPVQQDRDIRLSVLARTIVQIGSQDIEDSTGLAIEWPFAVRAWAAEALNFQGRLFDFLKRRIKV